MMRCCFGLLLVAIGATAHAFLPPERFKHLNLATDDDLNPLHGVPWAEGILENHAELMNYNDPLREFIRNLFNRTGAFEPTTAQGRFGRIATPKVIGQLLGAMKKNVYLAKTKYKGGITLALAKVKNQDGVTYSPLVYRTLLTLLQYKSNTRADYKEYYEGILETYPGGVHVPPNWDAWLEEKFTPDLANSPAPANINVHYDEYLFWIMKKISLAPPLETTNYAISEIGTFPDCGETSLRNFLKLILDKDGNYYLRILEDLGAVPELLAFFKDFNTRESQQDKTKDTSTENTARNAWANLTAGQKGVRYIPETHDMDSGADNMFILLKSLLPGLKMAPSWEAVFTEIEKVRIVHGLGQFVLESNKVKDNLGEILFRVEKLGGFSWYFQSLHFYIAPAPAQEIGVYPFTEEKEQVFKDVAIFYPATSLPMDFKEFPWYLYTWLRSEEKIETLIKNPSLPIPAVTGLLNRLRTYDARVRLIPMVGENSALGIDRMKMIVSDENLSLHKEYLVALIHYGQYDAAQCLAATPRFKEKFGHYLPGGPGPIVLSSDGRTLYSGSKSGVLRIWDLIRPEQKPYVFANSGIATSLALSADGHTLYSGGWGAIRVWDLKNRDKAPQVLTTQDDYGKWEPKALALSSDGQSLYAGSAESTNVWNLKLLGKLDSIQPKWLHDSSDRMISGIALAMSSNGQLLYIGGKPHRGNAIWNIQKEKMERDVFSDIPLTGANGFALSSDEHLYYSINRDIKSWNFRDSKNSEIGQAPSVVSSLVLSSDGRTLYSGLNDSTILIWDIQHLDKKPHILKGHENGIHSLVLSSDGRTLYSSSYDGTIRIWNLEEELRRAPAPAAVP